MKFLPYENYYITSKLTPEEVSSRLRENIIPRSRDLFRFNANTTRPYEGFIEHFHFDFSRIIKYRNSFLPNIQGKIYREGQGSLLHIKMQMHTAVTIFVIIWMSGVTFALVGAIYSMVSSKTFTPVIFIIVGMLLFGYLLTVGGFKYESSITKKFLADLLEAKPITFNAD